MAVACVDARQRTVLHHASTRGDATLCRDLCAIDGGALVTALDDEFNTPISYAALYGRALVLRELLAAPTVTVAVLNERNRFLMSPLQLARCSVQTRGAI